MGFMHRSIIGDFRTNATSDLIIESDIRSLPRAGESEVGSPCPDSKKIRGLLKKSPAWLFSVFECPVDANL